MIYGGEGERQGMRVKGSERGCGAGNEGKEQRYCARVNIEGTGMWSMWVRR